MNAPHPEMQASSDPFEQALRALVTRAQLDLPPADPVSEAMLDRAAQALPREQNDRLLHTTSTAQTDRMLERAAASIAIPRGFVFGRYLEKVRMTAGLSVDALAARLRIPSALVHDFTRYDLALVRVPPAALATLLDVLNLPLSALRSALERAVNGLNHMDGDEPLPVVASLGAYPTDLVEEVLTSTSDVLRQLRREDLVA